MVPLRRIDEEVLRELVIRLEIIHNPRESLGVDAKARLGVLLRQLDPQQERAVGFELARDVDAEFLDLLAVRSGILLRDGVVDLLHEAVDVLAVNKGVLAPRRRAGIVMLTDRIEGVAEIVAVFADASACAGNIRDADLLAVSADGWGVEGVSRNG